MAQPKVGIPPQKPSPALEALKRVYLFSSLTPQELNFLAAVVKKKDVLQGAVLFRDGDPAVSLYVVEKGTLQVVKQNPNGGDTTVLTALEVGTLFGEIPFVAGGTRTANVMASEQQASVIEITYDELERLAQVNPTFGVKLYKAMAAYLANHLKRTTAEVAGGKPEVRVANRRATGGSVAGGAAGGPKVVSSGEIIIEVDDDKS